MDHRGAEASPVTPILAVDVLDHLLAPFVLEIHVDIGRLLALPADEALEQQIVPGGVHGGDAQHIADGGVGGRAAPLAQDRRRGLVPGEADEVMDCQEIPRDVELFDHRQFFLQERGDPRANTIGIAPLRAVPGELFQPVQGAHALRDRLARIFVGEFLEIEPAGIGDVACGADGVRPFGEEADHFPWWLQMALGAWFQPEAGGGQGAFLADAGHHVLQGPPRGFVVEHIVGGENAETVGGGEPVEAVDPRPVLAPVETGRRDMAKAQQPFGQSGQPAGQAVEVAGRHGDQLEVRSCRGQVVERQIAGAFLLPVPLPIAHLAF